MNESRCILTVRGWKKDLGSFNVMEIEWIYYFNLLHEEELTEPSPKADSRVKKERENDTSRGYKSADFKFKL